MLLRIISSLGRKRAGRKKPAKPRTRKRCLPLGLEALESRYALDGHTLLWIGYDGQLPTSPAA
jgi:hypothetical protein